MAQGIFSGAIAQENTGGMLARAQLSFGILAENNDLRARSDLSFDLSTVTRTQEFRFSVATELEYPDSDSSLGLVSPTLQAEYARTSANASLGVTASYSRNEIDSFTAQEIEEDSDAPRQAELIADSGFRSDTRVSTRLTLATRSPVGAELGVGLQQVRYTGVDNVSLTDYDVFDTEAQLRFTVDQRIEARVSLRQSDLRSTDAGDDRIEQSVGIGTTLLLSQLARLDVNLDYTEIESSSAGQSTKTDSGPTFTAAAVWDRSNGELRFDVDSRITGGGTRFTAEAGRSHENPRGAFSWSVGASRGGDGLVHATLAFGYDVENQSSGFGAGLFREIRADAFGEEALQNRIDVNYRNALTERDAVEVGLGYRVTEPLVSEDEGVTSLDFTLGYSREVTRGIHLLTSLSHSRTRVESDSDQSETSLYFGIQRRFSWSP
ncbi:hypothetical protein [Roseivivax lentus]|nr:hypothetical protein [Roseivivax lentus]